MYLTYDDYKALGGLLDETTFIALEMQAECEVDWVTFNRLKGETTYPTELNKCMYLLIDLLDKKQKILSVGQSQDRATQSAIASQSNDGVSITYNVMGAKDSYSALSGEMGLVIHKCLNGVTNSLGHKLLYRGIYPNE